MNLYVVLKLSGANQLSISMNKLRLKSLTGFTLLELMVTLAIFLVLTGAIFAIFRGGRDSWITQDVQSELYQNGRRAMDVMIRELQESGRNTVTITQFIDPINSETHEVIGFASGRGSDTIAGEDGNHANNNYTHWDASGNVSWRSAVIYCVYQTSDGIKQLRRYVDYGPSAAYYGTSGVFPLIFTSITATTINILRGDTSTFSIDRDTDPTMTILANYIDTEDTNNNNTLDASENDGNSNTPIDNADSILNYGVNYTQNSGLLAVTLFLKKEMKQLAASGRFIIFTHKGSAQLRQP